MNGWRAGRSCRIAFVCLLLAACGKEVPPGFDTPDSVVHDTVADVYLVSNVQGAPLAKDGNGYIARVAPDGSMQRHWIQGGSNGVTLHAPKGMALRGDELWVADIDVLRSFDRRSGAVRGEVAVPGATCLDAVSVAPDGRIFVTDTGLDAELRPTGTDAIWQVVVAADAVGGAAAATVAPLVRGSELGQPHGLVARDGGVFVVSWRDGTFYQIDYRGVRTDLGKAPAGQLDGLARVEGDAASTAPAWVATSWSGQCVYRFDLTGGVSRVGGTFEQPAGCAFDGKRRLLLLPLSGKNRLELLPQ